MFIIISELLLVFRNTPFLTFICDGFGPGFAVVFSINAHAGSRYLGQPNP